MTQTNTSTVHTTADRVLGIAPADPQESVAYFYLTKLRCETDPYDVHHDLQAGASGFAVLDVRSPAAYDAEHIVGARSFPHHDMTPQAIAELDPELVYVTYGWGPGCNGGSRGAARLATQGLRVKEMVGGLEYWKRQEFPVEARN